MKKLTTQDFINKSKLVHGNLYDYRNTSYNGSATRLRIRCEKHGEFEQIANDHLSGKGCPECSKNKKLNITSFINKAKLVHGDLYDYSLSNITNYKRSVIIKCIIHGEFTQTPSDHLSGCGCPACVKNKKLDTNSFISKAKEVHGDLYDYSLSVYILSKEYIIIICKMHGNFKQMPYAHLHGNGCPRCIKSKGENIIMKYLDDNNIKYKHQMKFDGCINNRRLSFDFYLEDYNICIEYDGIQHFESVEFFGGDKTLEKNKKLDTIKNEFCIQNNIILIRIRYDEDIIERLLLLNLV